MTSTQISALRERFEQDTSLASDLMQASALLEIAYQLAVMNEREQRRAGALSELTEETIRRGMAQ